MPRSVLWFESTDAAHPREEGVRPPPHLWHAALLRESDPVAPVVGSLILNLDRMGSERFDQEVRVPRVDFLVLARVNDEQWGGRGGDERLDGKHLSQGIPGAVWTDEVVHAAFVRDGGIERDHRVDRGREVGPAGNPLRIVGKRDLGIDRRIRCRASGGETRREVPSGGEPDEPDLVGVDVERRCLGSDVLHRSCTIGEEIRVIVVTPSADAMPKDDRGDSVRREPSRGGAGLDAKAALVGIAAPARDDDRGSGSAGSIGCEVVEPRSISATVVPGVRRPLWPQELLSLVPVGPRRDAPRAHQNAEPHEHQPRSDRECLDGATAWKLQGPNARRWALRWQSILGFRVLLWYGAGVREGVRH